MCLWPSAQVICNRFVIDKHYMMESGERGEMDRAREIKGEGEGRRECNAGRVREVKAVHTLIRFYQTRAKSQVPVFGIIVDTHALAVRPFESKERSLGW